MPLASIIPVVSLGDTEAKRNPMPDPDEELDVSGYQCPLPVLKAKRRLESMAPGSVLRLIATDPAAVIDVAHFCNEQGHELLSSLAGDRLWIFLIRKRSQSAS
jgi:tRNA 2-thiouridine synthesizing protein A